MKAVEFNSTIFQKTRRLCSRYADAALPSLSISNRTALAKNLRKGSARRPPTPYRQLYIVATACSMTSEARTSGYVMASMKGSI
jgi:hypothetical protein